ncbi:mechanosensitive ion channel family protein [Diaphorobacter limosus]|uniref:Mechanosensitive ion channel family protein n=1 Tax=Diaphorobacter limosus TaxID=3036128 RepID=A0ABZ0J054_9BURK|nr:mechanosensitive ion channel family protein [Diaphorobacter sp. Y-1]WOO31620.1 mechanosensitive ion channel family protein [Diaphorobacter sp. Y-1]HRM48617.1 mechanosensitive ion channel family protein [Alicycliphilus sp.]HRP20514.1 mechanosensitive ion channel family protein [Alicycliphilus sp.]
MTVLTLFLSLSPWMQATIGLACLLLLAYVVQALAQYLLLHTVPRLRERMDVRWARVLWHDQVLRRLARVVPSLVVQAGIGAVPHLDPVAFAVIRNLAVALTVLQLVRTLNALLNAILQEQESRPEGARTATRSIKSYVQLGKLALALIGAIVIVAVLIDRSPLILLSGLGAMSAVLMLVFKDTILSFTAGVQLSSNDMLRVGDWIEMPQMGADGAVIDIALHTVKVQNWDKTITTIPTWRLMSESYRNWRGMSESGGRRIKRQLRIDSATVRFLSDADIDRLERIALLAPYLAAKRQAVHSANAALGEGAAVPANLRRLTNIGTFRAYVQAYLQAHPGVHQGMTLMVRMLEPTAEGVPLELYCFTATTAWVQYEAIQGDIFDHLLALLPEFDLRLYQSPTGWDIRSGLQQKGLP